MKQCFSRADLKGCIDYTPLWGQKQHEQASWKENSRSVIGKRQSLLFSVLSLPLFQRELPWQTREAVISTHPLSMLIIKTHLQASEGKKGIDLYQASSKKLVTDWNTLNSSILLVRQYPLKKRNTTAVEDPFSLTAAVVFLHYLAKFFGFCSFLSPKKAPLPMKSGGREEKKNGLYGSFYLWGCAVSFFHCTYCSFARVISLWWVNFSSVLPWLLMKDKSWEKAGQQIPRSV